MKRKQPVGIWIITCLSSNADFVKYGKCIKGEVYPFKTNTEALMEADKLAKNILDVEDKIYILHVFDNGQIRKYSLEYHMEILLRMARQETV